MLFGYLTLFTALILSMSAAVYSILGLTAIFAAAFWPIVVLGGSLEFGKIVTTLWLHKYWDRAEIQYKVYLCSAVVILMVLTSMGVFGFLSKAHLDQAVPSGDIQAQVQIFDDKIQTQKDNIKTARSALTQMDSAVDQVMGRSSDEKGADKAVAIRRSQARERTALQNDISKAQTEITKLQEQRAPIASQARQVEAEVGPIKYIAALIYGDNPDANILEKAVRWVIILIVVVFDPLALTLLLAATKTFEWENNVNLFNDKKKKNEEPVDGENVDSWFTRVKERARFWDQTQVETQENKIEFEGVRAPGGEWIQTGPNIPVPKNINDTDNLEPVFDRQKDFPDYETDDGLLTNEQLIKESDPLAHVIVPEIPDHDHLHRMARAMWMGGNPEMDEREYHAQHQSGEIDQLPWHDEEHINNMPISDGEKKQLIERFHNTSASKTTFFEVAPLGLEPDNTINKISGEVKGFGTQFPSDPNKGDMFLRVDRLPSVLYKFNGISWIEVDKALTDNHAYNDAYIDHLIAKIESGEYDPDLLSDAEKDSIERKLQS